MTEASVWTLSMGVCVALAIGCAVLGQWLGVTAGLLVALNTWSARYFLVR